MNRATWLAWAMLGVWASALLGLQGTLARGSLGAWTPDLALAVLVALAARIPVHELPKLGLAMAVARAAVSVDAPAAVLASSLAAVAIARGVRSVVEIDSAPLSASLAFALALAQSAWLELVHRVRLGPEVQRALDSAGESVSSASAWRMALSTAVCVALLGGALARLPGLSPLRKRKTWAVAGSSR